MVLSKIFTWQLQISYALYIGMSIATYSEVSLVKLPNTLSGNEVIMFTTNVRSRWVFPIPFNLDICTVNCIRETEGIFWEKVALNSLVSRWRVPFEFSFCEGKTRFTHAIAANEQTLTTSKYKNWICALSNWQVSDCDRYL